MFKLFGFHAYRTSERNVYGVDDPYCPSTEVVFRRNSDLMMHERRKKKGTT